MGKTVELIGKSLEWLRSLADECRTQGKLGALTETLTGIDKYREELIKGYGANHVALCEDVTVAMMAFTGTADQKKTAKRSLKRACRRGTDGKYIFSFKGDRCMIEPYTIDRMDAVNQAWKVLGELVSDDTIINMKKLFNDGVKVLQAEQAAAKEQAERARKIMEAETAGVVKETAKNMLKRAGVEPTAASIAIAEKIAKANIK